MRIVYALILVCLRFIGVVKGHGRLLEPPSRSSMWRVGFNSTRNYQDNALYCGGYSNQWETNGGKCGVCGDQWQGPRDNEAGGKYASGIIVRRYTSASIIDVNVELTASHLGNSWGYDEEGLGCLGCGRQEQFYACSDISIASNHTTASPAEAIRPAQLGSRVTGSMLIAWLLNVLKPNITISEVW